MIVYCEGRAKQYKISKTNLLEVNNQPYHFKIPFYVGKATENRPIMVKSTKCILEYNTLIEGNLIWRMKIELDVLILANLAAHCIRTRRSSSNSDELEAIQNEMEAPLSELDKLLFIWIAPSLYRTGWTASTSFQTAFRSSEMDEPLSVHLFNCSHFIWSASRSSKWTAFILTIHSSSYLDELLPVQKKWNAKLAKLRTP